MKTSLLLKPLYANCGRNINSLSLQWIPNTSTKHVTQNPTTSTRIPFASLSPSQTKMASHGEDTGASKSVVSEDQGEKRNPAVSFGFTKTVSKFKSSNGDALLKKDDRDYLTGIDRNELQRYA